MHEHCGPVCVPLPEMDVSLPSKRGQDSGSDWVGSSARYLDQCQYGRPREEEEVSWRRRRRRLRKQESRTILVATFFSHGLFERPDVMSMPDGEPG